MEQLEQIDFSKFTKEELIELMKVHNRLTLTLDGLWFVAAEKKYGLDAAIELDIMAWEGYGFREARRLKKFLGVEEPTINDIGKMMMLSPVFAFLGPKVEIKGNKGILTVTDCLPQKARVRDGRGEFECKPVGLAYFKTFCEEISPHLKWKCVVCPPDEHPPDVWCQWEFEL